MTGSGFCTECGVGLLPSDLNTTRKMDASHLAAAAEGRWEPAAAQATLIDNWVTLHLLDTGEVMPLCERNEFTLGLGTIFCCIHPKGNKKPSRLVMMNFIVVDNDVVQVDILSPRTEHVMAQGLFAGDSAAQPFPGPFRHLEIAENLGFRGMEECHQVLLFMGIQPARQLGNIDHLFRQQRLQRWLVHGKIAPEVLAQICREFREIADAVEAGTVIPQMPEIPVPPAPRSTRSGVCDRSELTFDDDEIPF